MTKHKKNKKIVLAIILTIFLMIIAGFVIWRVINRNPNAKVLEALDNTISEWVPNSIFNDITNIEEYIGDGEYSVETKVETEVPLIGDIAVTAKQNISKDQINVKGDFDIALMLPVTYKMVLDKDGIGLSVPLLDERIFYIDYYESKGDGLEEYINIDEACEYAAKYYEIMTGLGSFHSNKDEFAKSIKTSLENVSFKECEEETTTYKSDGTEDVYKAVVSKEKLSEIVDIFIKNNNLVDNYFLFGNEEILKNSLDSSEIQIYVGITEEKITYIKLDNNITSYEIKKIKTDEDTERISLSKGDSELISIEMSRRENENVYLIKNNNMLLNVRYDKNNDKLSLKVSRNSEEYGIDITIKRFENSIKFEVDYFDINDTYFGGFISFSKNMEEIKVEGEKFNIGKLNKEEFDNLKKEIYSEILKVIGW